MLNAPDAASTRPYLLRALHEWCTDQGYTPYVAVLVDETVQVPLEYVKNGEIVLNVSYDATAGMTLGNEFIELCIAILGPPRCVRPSGFRGLKAEGCLITGDVFK